MKKIRLTKRSVEAIVPAPNKDMVVRDDEVRGFAIRVKPSGTRTYVLLYSHRNRDRTVTIGRHGDLTAEAARKEAMALRGVIAKGGDPAAERTREREIPTMCVLAERYMAEHAILRKKPLSVRADRCLLKGHILPLLGDRQVSEITRADLRRFAHDVAAGKTALDQKTGLRGRRIVRGGRGAANRALTLLSRMFSLAEDWGYRRPGDNPCRGVERFSEAAGRARARFLSEVQIARLGDALAAAEKANPRHRMPANIVRLLFLTGARSGEITGLRREYIDLERGLIWLPQSKTGPKPIVLSAAARQLLAELVGGGPGTGFLFPAPRPPRSAGERPYAGLKRFWEKMRKEAGLGDARIHDLRHTHASVAIAGGSSLLVVGKLLGHSQSLTTERYAHLADDPLRQAAETTGGRIAAMLAGHRPAIRSFDRSRRSG